MVISTISAADRGGPPCEWSNDVVAPEAWDPCFLKPMETAVLATHDGQVIYMKDKFGKAFTQVLGSKAEFRSGLVLFFYDYMDNDKPIHLQMECQAGILTFVHEEGSVKVGDVLYRYKDPRGYNGQWNGPRGAWIVPKEYSGWEYTPPQVLINGVWCDIPVGFPPLTPEARNQLSARLRWDLSVKPVVRVGSWRKL